MQYYYPPSLPADLNVGFETFQKLNDAADEHLDALLDTVVALESETGKKCEADIVTWRGMMTKVSIIDCNRGHRSDQKSQILTAPFDMMNGYVILSGLRMVRLLHLLFGFQFRDERDMLPGRLPPPECRIQTYLTNMQGTMWAFPYQCGP